MKELRRWARGPRLDAQGLSRCYVCADLYSICTACGIISTLCSTLAWRVILTPRPESLSGDYLQEHYIIPQITIYNRRLYTTTFTIGVSRWPPPRPSSDDHPASPVIIALSRQQIALITHDRITGVNYGSIEASELCVAARTYQVMFNSAGKLLRTVEQFSIIILHCAI